MEEHELRYLLANLRKSIEFWFLMSGSDVEISENKIPQRNKLNGASFHQIQTSIVAILQHDLHQVEKLYFKRKEGIFSTTLSPVNLVTVQKLIDDFEWVSGSVHIRDSLKYQDEAIIQVPSIETGLNSLTSASLEQFLSAWTLRHLEANCLCACLQALVTDKELLETYYKPRSFLRNEIYATTLFISLSALELQQYSLLSQIDPDLYKVTPRGFTVTRKRSNSQPNISISVTKKFVKPECTQETSPPSLFKSTSMKCNLTEAFLPTFRRIKSLPELVNESSYIHVWPTHSRPRSKTMTAKTIQTTEPKTLSHKELKHKLTSDLGVDISPSSSLSYSGDDTQPSTSASSNISQSTLTSLVSNTTNISVSSTKTTRPIQLVKCDNIKIWTDREWELQQQQSESIPARTTQSCSIPHNVKKTKTISPINSFLSSLFVTPPTTGSCASWSSHQISTPYISSDPSDNISCYPCNSCRDSDLSSSSGVFDSFLPKYGKKLRTRKSQNLFEDGISSLDQKCYECSALAKGETATEPTVKRIPKNSQSLTAFLQMAQLSRNNTELEKENAHFRISEAIISAIEHIKWAKIEPDKLRRQNETTTAMDWLENEQNQKTNQSKDTEESQSNYSQTIDHIYSAEVGEICLDSLSAEVVGLCLISKFNDKHLPKVSELKWLVAEEDTPQQLLPMPDNSYSSNPDDNIMPSVIRGTKYWAPPRQQIIFTDHPLPNRKELIRKQNSRCAGCGMRVSPQYLSSFRYCTYLGKYHCTGCHRNQISAIPAKILQMWNFKCYPVSVFAYRLLEQMHAYPLFYVPDLNSELYMRSKLLLAARTKRVQLRYVKDFIKICRFATEEQNYFNSIPDYICADPDTWSMSDLVDANKKSLQHYIAELILKCESHIFKCVLCTARGFICEHCRLDEVLFPWQNKIFCCDRCGARFHENCWKSMLENCSRCQRMESRKDESNDIILKRY